MKWKALAACALTAVALAVAGCGGGQSSSGKAGAPQGPDLKGKKLVMYVSFHEDTAKQLADSFKKKTGADVSFIRLPTGEALARIQAERMLQKQISGWGAQRMPMRRLQPMVCWKPISLLMPA